MTPIVCSNVELFTGGTRQIVAATDEVRIERVLTRGDIARDPIIIIRAEAAIVAAAIARVRTREPFRSASRVLGHITHERGQRWALVGDRNVVKLILLLEDEHHEPLRGRAHFEGYELDGLERACRLVMNTESPHRSSVPSQKRT